MVLGIITLLAVFSTGGLYTKEEQAGLFGLSVAAISFSGFGMAGGRPGRGMAIAGLVMGILGAIEWVTTLG